MIVIFLNLTPSWRRLLSYRNQSIDLPSKSMDWFLYDNDLRHERVNSSTQKQRSDSSLICCLPITVVLHVAFYQVMLNLRNEHSVIFQFKKCWGIQFHWQFWTANSCFWLVLVFCCESLIFIKKRNENNKYTNFMIKNNKRMPKK